MDEMQVARSIEILALDMRKPDDVGLCYPLSVVRRGIRRRIDKGKRVG